MLALQAKTILEAIIDGSAPITRTYTDIHKLPSDDCTVWELEIETVHKDYLTFDMVGLNILGLREVVDRQGVTLVDPKRPLAVIDWLTGAQSAALETAVMSAVAQSVPR